MISYSLTLTILYECCNDHWSEYDEGRKLTVKYCPCYCKRFQVKLDKRLKLPENTCLITLWFPFLFNIKLWNKLSSMPLFIILISQKKSCNIRRQFWSTYYFSSISNYILFLIGRYVAKPLMCWSLMKFGWSLVEIVKIKI